MATVAILAVVMLLPGISGALTSGEEHATDSFTIGEIAEEIGAAQLYDLGLSGEGVTVAVIDTGVADVSGLDGDDKVIHGPDLSFEAGVPELYNRDSYGHGTVMASIIAGDERGRQGFQGIAPGARILSVKVADNTGAVDVSQVIAAIDFVIETKDETGARVINLSYRTDGGDDPSTDPLIAAVERAWDAGIVVVVSAGNDGDETGRLGNPALSPYVIAVASSGQSNKDGLEVSSFSNNGNKNRAPDITAPGDRVLGLAAPGSRLVQENPGAFIDDRFLRGSGTSQAAAVVSGAVALLLEAQPDLTPDDVKLALMLGADDKKDRTLSAAHKDKNVETLTGDLTELDGWGDVLKAREKVAKELEKLAEAQADLAEALAAGDEKEIEKAEKNVAKAEAKVAKEEAKVAEAKAKIADSAQATAGLEKLAEKWGGDKLGKIKLDKELGAGWINIARAVQYGPIGVAQDHPRSDGSGSLDAARGSAIALTPDGTEIVGDVTFAGSTWSGSTWSGSTWSGSTWSGSTWSGSTWSGSTWSGSTWSGSTWSGSTWSGSTWSGSTWSGSTWSGSTWSGSSWSGAEWD